MLRADWIDAHDESRGGLARLIEVVCMELTTGAPWRWCGVVAMERVYRERIYNLTFGVLDGCALAQGNIGQRAWTVVTCAGAVAFGWCCLPSK